MCRWARGLRGRPLLALAIGLAGLGVAGDPAGAQDGGRRLPQSPVVVDTHDRVVGAVFGLGVKVLVGDRVAVLGIGRDQFTGGQARVEFESTDCSGPPLLVPSVPPGPAAILGEVGVGPPSVLLAPGGPPESRTVRSRWLADVAPPACLAVTATVLDVLPAEALMDLGAFTPPFRIE